MQTQQQQPINKPIPGVMFGLTHTVEGELIIREPKILKVGIGLPKGPALDVWIAPDGGWRVRYGYKADEVKIATYKNRKDAEAKYISALASAPVCPYPRKIGYFTFTKPIINQAGHEQFVADFDAIESAGPTPTEIDIVLLDDQPFAGAYQMWSASELLCKGDGVTAMRLIKLATAEEKELAATYAEAGERYFPITNCWTGSCPYSKETVKNGKPQPSACKPGSDLKFQLASNIRVGGTAYFHTTGFRSISNTFSSLHRISMLTGGRLAGVPLKMVLRPFRTNHNGQAATQYAVSLEFRAPDVATLRQKLLETAFQFRETALGQIAAPERHPHLIEAPATGEAIDEGEEDPPIGAAAMAAEFYPDATEEEPAAAQEQPLPATLPAAAEASNNKTSGLAAKMRQSREKGTAAAPATAAASAPAEGGTAGTSSAAPAQPAMPPGGDIPGDMF